MISLLVALVVSQADVLTPPPAPPAFPDGVEEQQPPPAAFPPGVPYKPQSVHRYEPRVSTGVLVGRVSLSVGFTATAVLLGALLYLGTFSFYPGYLMTFSLAPVAVTIASALFGKNFARELREAIPVAIGAVVGAALLALLLQATLGPIAALAVPLAVAAVGAPLILQAMKPLRPVTPLRDAEPIAAVSAFSF